MKTLWVGADPGKSGAFGFIDNDTLQADATNLVFQGKDLDVDWAYNYLKMRCEGYELCVMSLEKVNGDSGLSGSSAFTFGFNCGMLRAIILKLSSDIGLRVLYPQPKIWKKAVLFGTAMDKDAAVTYVKSMYPKANIVPEGCRVPSVDRCEAICLAEYSKKTMNIKD
jgi:crossover junction endodeoxyribonuclease RuvC